ncbi:MAG: hypothetical protein ACTSXQ_03415 [Alphaproteobacteria bacterium]
MITLLKLFFILFFVVPFLLVVLFGVTFSFLPFFLRRKLRRFQKDFEEAQQKNDAGGETEGSMVQCNKCSVYYVEGTEHWCLKKEE